MSFDAPIVVRRSLWVHLLLLIGSLTFVAGGVFILIIGADRLVGWSTIVFFGGCAIIGAWQVFDSRARLILDDTGIFDRTLGIGMIPWKEILDAYPKAIGSSRFVCLVLRNPEQFEAKLPSNRRRFSKMNARLGFTDFTINLVGLAIDPNEICEYIQKRVAIENEGIR